MYFKGFLFWSHDDWELISINQYSTVTLDSSENSINSTTCSYYSSRGLNKPEKAIIIKFISLDKKNVLKNSFDSVYLDGYDWCEAWGDLSLLFPKLIFFEICLFMISSYYIYFCAVNSGKKYYKKLKKKH